MREECKSLCALVVKILLLSILLSCKTITNVVEAGGNVLNGSVFKKTKLELKRTPDKELEVRKILTTDGKTGLEIKFKQLPFVTFYGTDSDSAGRFNLTQMRYLAGNPGGWNEYYVQINGTGYYCPEGEESFVLDDIGGKSKISEGSIRRQDSRFYGNEAKDLLRSRALRITAVTDWMKEQEIQTDKKITTQKEFEKYWQPLLFPETVSSKKQSELYKNNKEKFKITNILSDEYKWNQTYTGLYFPDELKEVRNSGTLYRDWEEAVSWFYMEYQWETITKNISEKFYFRRT
ncbi:hypothetical protein FACS1894190_08850 [Spirochaetia bacterium]|nr:hypothetical protein FACS1894190_08850 [Spirochaetia bacterium]